MLRVLARLWQRLASLFEGVCSRIVEPLCTGPLALALPYTGTSENACAHTDRAELFVVDTTLIHDERFASYNQSRMELSCRIAINEPRRRVQYPATRKHKKSVRYIESERGP